MLSSYLLDTTLADLNHDEFALGHLGRWALAALRAVLESRHSCAKRSCGVPIEVRELEAS
jgi:hypothetical protein